MDEDFRLHGETVIRADDFCPADRERAAKLLEMLKPKRKKRLSTPEDEEWVPLRKIFKATKIPMAAAEVVEKALNAMKVRDEIGEKNLWQALEYWAADYLSGLEDAGGEQPVTIGPPDTTGTAALANDKYRITAGV